MMDNNFGRAKRPDAQTTSSPTPPETMDAREDGMAVSQMAQSRLPGFVRAARISHSADARRGGWWSALSFGVLLLASGAACLERLAWMGGR